MTIGELAKLMVKLIVNSEQLERVLTNKMDSKIEELARATKKGFDEVHDRINNFQQETQENFAKVRRDIFDIKDNYATKEELAAVSVRVESLEHRRK